MMLVTGLGLARLLLILIWALAICSVVANAFEVPAPWRLGRLERPAMYAAFFLGGSAFWILVVSSGSALSIALLLGSVVAVPVAGLLLGRALERKDAAEPPAPQRTPGPPRDARVQSPTEPPRAA
jgi:hypothetical protein